VERRDLRAASDIRNRLRDIIRRKIEDEQAPMRAVRIILSQVGIVQPIYIGYITQRRVMKGTAHDYHLSSIDDITG
jgi:predicted anti-sigma-YlaC factor YlaD